ncbi:MAG: tyrosine-type recombinase/integrase [Actinomycetota bacterium]|nr:tyrosine-type recombinase/integrase [Actinomycetota bacterium]
MGPDHKLHKAPHTFPSDVAAEAWLAIERRKIDLGTWGAVERSDGVTLRAYSTRWLEHRQLRPRTRAHYEALLERLILPELGDAQIVTVTPAKVREWHTGLGSDRPTQTAHAYALLHAICATAVLDEVLDANPCRIRGASQTARKRDIDVLTPAQVDKLAAKMPARLRASVHMAAWCQLRWGETSELRRGDISADCSVLRVRRAVTHTTKDGFVVGPPKTSAGMRDITVPPHIRPIIKSHLKNHVGKDADSLLFPGDDGRHMSSPAYRFYFVKARKAIGKPNLTPHQLRHTGAVLAAQSGATTAELMARLGHTSVQMALKYQHVAEGRDAELAQRLSALAKAKV